MFDFYSSSLRKKILTTFLIVGTVPFLLLLAYVIFLSQNKIIEKTIEDQYYAVGNVKELVTRHLDTLQREVRFLATLDIMDDLLVDDIDKRISRLLEKKAKDYENELSFIVVNKTHQVVASSDKDIIGKRFYKNSSQKDFFQKGECLYFVAKVFSSFDKRYIGSVFLKFPLKNLKRYLVDKIEVHSYMLNSKEKRTVGVIPAKITVDFKGVTGHVITDDYLVVYKRFDKYLKGWYIVYMVNKTKALALLYDFIRFMLYIAVVIVPIIIYVSIKISKSIVKPVEKLTKFADEITQTQDYSKEIEIHSKDEIAILSESFNEMLKTTHSALEKLEEENKLRLKRFTKLIEIFNTIIQTTSEEECIDVSLQEIKKLTKQEHLNFFRTRPKKIPFEYVELYVNNFEKNEKEFYGYIELGIKHFRDDIERDFYRSIGSMIVLQIEKIRLIDKTMAASRAKSAFISNMSHELRTPLNAIIGFSQFMLSYEELTEDQQDTIANIESSAHYLLGMINDILDIAKIEAGKMEAHKERVNVKELLQGAYDMLKPLADDKELEFDFTFDETSEYKEVETDPKMLKQIVVNLVSNAIKFTKEGSVTIDLKIDESWMEVTVKDTGIGIDIEDMKMLFNDFTQVENIMQKKHKGTGLGLSLSKKMAKILGGDIELYSQGLGKGVTSVLKLPVITN